MKIQASETIRTACSRIARATPLAAMAAVALSFSAVTSGASAALLEEDFAGADGTLPAGWVSQEKSGGPASIQNNELSGNKDREIEYTGQIFGPGITVSVDVKFDSFGTSTWAGLYFGRDADRDSSLYGVTIHRGQELTISDKDGFFWSDHKVRATPADGFETDVWYTIKAQYAQDGNSISAQVYDRDSGELVVSASASDLAGGALTGHFGLTDSQGVVFDNLQIVPEPGALGLMGLGMLILSARRRRS